MRGHSGPHLFCFNAKKKERIKQKRGPSFGRVRRFIDGDSTLIVSMARKERKNARKNQTLFILPPREFVDFFKRLSMSLSFNWKGDGYDWKSRPAETN